MAMYNYQYGNIHDNIGRGSILEIEAMNQMNTKIDQLSMTLERMQSNSVASTSLICDMCGGEGHQVADCMSYIHEQRYEQTNAIFNNTFTSRPTGDLYSDTYNPGWRNHPNFSWPNQNQLDQNFFQTNWPPNFQQQPFNSQPIQNQLPPQNQKSHLEELFENFIVEQKRSSDATQQQIQQLTTKMEQLQTQSQMLENQIAQQALESTQQGNYDELPNQTEKNLQGEIHTIALGSGKQLEERTNKTEPPQKQIDPKPPKDSHMLIDTIEEAHHQTQLERHKQKSEELQMIEDKAPQICQDTYAKLYKDKTKSKKLKIGDIILYLNSCFILFPGKSKATWSGPIKTPKICPHKNVENWGEKSGVFKNNGPRRKIYRGGEPIGKGRLYSFSPPT